MTEVAMRRTFFTKKGSVYTQIISRRGKEFWIKQDKGKEVQPLMGGIHISREKFKELVREYPASLLDTTYCFDAKAEKEFFEDAKREKFTGKIEDEATVVFFLVKKGPNKYGIGCSSLVEKIEETD
ncbi:MAG: hypothetical protein WAK60_04650 [Sedimentisphaerales bacterium]